MNNLHCFNLIQIIVGRILTPKLLHKANAELLGIFSTTIYFNPADSAR